MYNACRYPSIAGFPGVSRTNSGHLGGLTGNEVLDEAPKATDSAALGAACVCVIRKRS
jgi:hypothetical protein